MIPTPSGAVNWCEGNRLGDAEAVNVFGRSAVKDAKCDAVSFLFEARYSRLALPCATCATSDFADLAQWLSTDAHENRFLPLAKVMIDDPDSEAKRKALGLILFHLTDSRPGDKTAAAAAAAATKRMRSIAGPPCSATTVMSVATEATFIMIPGSSDDGRPWRIDGWRGVTKDGIYAPLKVK